MDNLSKWIKIVPEAIEILKEQLTFKELNKIRRINRTFFHKIKEVLPQYLKWRIISEQSKWKTQYTLELTGYILNSETDKVEHKLLYHQQYDDNTWNLPRKIFWESTYGIPLEYFENIEKIFPYGYRKFSNKYLSKESLKYTINKQRRCLREEIIFETYEYTIPDEQVREYYFNQL